MGVKNLSNNAAINDDHHGEEHVSWSRRVFLKHLGIAGGSSLLLGNLPMTAFSGSPLAMGLAGAQEERILVLIRLQGGNDGLNTVVPISDYSLYRSFRPSVFIPEQEALMLTPELGLHPSLQPLIQMKNQGALKLLNNVGYPNQNLSHFRSSDIWASASDAEVTWQTGWLGRYFEDRYPDFLIHPPTIPPAIQIGGAGDLIFNGTKDINYAVSVPTPELLEYIASTGGLYDASDVPDCLYGEQLSFLRTISNNSFGYADAIAKAYNKGSNTAQYSGNLGRQMSVVARLIKGQLGTRLYVVTLNGFDTHAGQLNAHAQLLQSLSSNIAAFFADLTSGGWDKKVLAFTFSEFGRRSAQNASQGTDHGAAAPSFVFGPSLEGFETLGGRPDLSDLDADGNLKMRLDFRSLYATLLDRWLCVDPSLVDIIMGRGFERMDLGFDCQTVALQGKPSKGLLRHEVRYEGNRQASVWMHLPMHGELKLELFNVMGQSHGVFYKAFAAAGEQWVPVPSHATRIPGYYVYRISFQGRMYSGKAKIV
jgi:uncharacterized protein (DUF1501 family)